MSSPFDVLAGSYAATWSDTPEGRGQRGEVWRVADRLFHGGDRILDLGCGTGDDALHFGDRGVEVHAIDSSRKMVEAARARGVNAHWRWMEDLATVQGRFDGAVSNFGALNCVADLVAVSRQLGRLIRPNGYVALCVMGRFSWRETARYLLEGNFAKATRRWPGKTMWRGTLITYWTGREVRRSFDPHFEFVQRVSIGNGDHQLYVLQRRVR
jgi:SAM-dependent methyltransferase